MKKNIIDAIGQAIVAHWILITLVIVEIFLCGSLLTFSPTDSSWFYHATQAQAYKNIFGFFGCHAAALLVYLFGRSAAMFVLATWYALACYVGIYVLKKFTMKTEWDRALGVLVCCCATAVLCQIYLIWSYDFSYPGGILGRYLTLQFLASFDSVTQKIIVWTMWLSSIILIARCSYFPVLVRIGHGISYCCHPEKIPARMIFGFYVGMKRVVQALGWLLKKTLDICTGASLKKINSSIVEFEQEEFIDRDIERVVQDLFWHDYIGVQEEKKDTAAPRVISFDKPVTLYHEIKAYEEEKSHEVDQSYQASSHTSFQMNIDAVGDEHGMKNLFEKAVEKNIDALKHPAKVYELPVLPVKKVEQKVMQEKQEVLAMQAKLLEEKLEQFDIKGAVVAMHAGPVVTLFEYQPDIKVKVSRILALEDDLAMALKALSIRIIAPIPGRSVVGFEVANQHRQDVVMARILQSAEFKNYHGALPMIFGQDTLGNDVIGDLAKMPHLLIAGSTGSGKSVALNAMLVSLLCSLKPSQLKLIIIDPKRLEFAAYDGIAHLLFPIVTETKKAIPILKWVVQTMEQRYEIMAKYGVRNLPDYQTAAKKNKEMEAMPLMVVIIDELADLMMTAGKAVEDSIARIAQMARAAGIHMIIATQRPSVDVITGMIKVNFPNRVAFKVTSKIDSRTILDAGGAEKLLGRGDMLFLDASKSHLVRVHGAYISDQEIHDVVAQIKRQQKVQYLDIFEHLSHKDNDELLDGDDELYQEIVQFLQELDEVSISMLQRRFRIGYNRSARIISMLESKGLVMSIEGGKTRRVVK